jgi:TonB family protein
MEMEMSALEMDKVERHGQCVKRMRSLCDMHRVPFGGPGNVEDLITALKHNRHFAMDFWALVGDLSAREQGSLDDEEMLDVIVEGSTDLGVASLPEQSGSAVRELRQMLAGVDIDTPAFLPDPIERPEDSLVSSARREWRRQATVVSLPDRMSRAGSRERRRVDAGGSKPTESIETIVARRTINEALSRLEQTSLELREQLAAIEEQVPEPKAVAAESSTAERVDEKQAPAIDKEPLPEIRERPREMKNEVAADELIHRRQPSLREEGLPLWTSEPPVVVEHVVVSDPADVQLGDGRTLASPRTPLREYDPPSIRRLSHRGREREDDSSSSAPLSSYAREDRRRWQGGRVAAVILLLALAGGGVYAATHVETVRSAWERAEPSLNASYAAFVERLQVLKREATTKSSDAASDGGVQSGDVESKAATAASGAVATAPAAATPTAGDAGLRSNASGSAAVGLNASHVQDNAGPVSEAAAGGAPQEPKAHDSTALRSKRESQGRESQGDAPEPAIPDAGVVHVPAATMETNLIASRVPAYPEAAKAEGVEGPVVMEALISQNGSVERVRVIDGDRRLRAAAEDAVLKWHYRPYLSSGHPVDVATTVRVDFRLPRGLGR